MKSASFFRTLMHSMERTLDVIYLLLFLFIPVHYSTNASSVLKAVNICDPLISPQTPHPPGTSSLPPCSPDEAISDPDNGIQMTTIDAVSVTDTTASDPVPSPSEMPNGSAYPSHTERQRSAQLQEVWCAYIEMCITEGKHLFSLSGIMITYVDVPESPPVLNVPL